MSRSNYLVLLACGIIVAGIFFNVIVSSFPYNPLSQDLPWLTRSNVVRFKFFFPEGFAFFTRNPQEVSYSIYAFDDQSIHLINLKNGSVSNYFGVSKTSRYKLIKLQEIVAQVDPEDWKKTKIDLDQLLQSYDTIQSVDTAYNSNYYEGMYLITAAKPIPWAWATLDNVNQEYSYIALKVTND